MRGLRWQMRSLQGRLLGLVLGAVTVVWIGAALLTWNDARSELDDLLDGHLAQAAAFLVVQQIRGGDPNDYNDIADAPSFHKYSPKVAFQVFYRGRLILRSHNAGLAPLSNVGLGFATVRQNDGSRWRVFATRGDDIDMQVYVGEQTESRTAILWAILRSALWPSGLAMPLSALATWWAVNQGLAPLRQISRSLHRRQAQALDPLSLTGMPSEIRPLVNALNSLFERIEFMVASERRFTADAAHELRTPIAAIRVQAQVAMGAGPDAAQRQHALQSTLDGCDRATRLVEQLLMLARVELSPSSTNATVNLNTVTARVAMDLAPASLARQQTLELEAADACTVQGDDVLVGVLVRNLIDNALRYSPDKARVEVSVSMESGRVVLRVQDSGPGMTDEQLARLGERFYRVPGNGQVGSGLGWSIVKRIVAAFGAQVQVSRSTRLGGLSVSVVWPQLTTA